MFVKDNISSYNLNININSKALKNKMVEVSTKLMFEDNKNSERRSIFEIEYCTVVQVDEKVKEKKTLEKILLCDVQNEIYPKLKTLFVKLINDAGYPKVKFEKEIDFAKLYSEK